MKDQGRRYGQHGLWVSSADFDDARARQLALENLELRGRSPDEAAARSAYLDLIGIDSGQRVLDVGCGSGVVLRDVGRRVGPGGSATGLDPSAALLAIARELAEREGIADRIELRQGSALALPFADGAFDAVIAATVLIHIPDGESAVAEMIRVARPGGRIGVFDRDNDSMILSHPDRAITRRIIAAGADESAPESWLPRRLPGIFQQAGLLDVQTRGFTTTEREPLGFYGRNFTRFAAVAREVGAISDEEHRIWTESLQAQADRGAFLAGITHLFTWGQKPG